MSEKQLWIKRHELMESIRAEVKPSTMDLINDLLELELQIERKEVDGQKQAYFTLTKINDH